MLPDPNLVGIFRYQTNRKNMKTTIEDLQTLSSLVSSLKSVTSTTAKLELLELAKNNEFVKKALFHTYHPYYTYFITSEKYAKMEKQFPIANNDFGSIFDLLDQFRLRNITGGSAVIALKSFISQFPEFAELILQMIDRDFKAGIGVTQINKIFGDMIPRFDVALGLVIEEVEPDLSADDYYASRKLDGVRCVAIFNEVGKVSTFSRVGNQFSQLSVLEAELETLGLKNMVLDGEFCIINANGLEDFKAASSAIKKKDYTIPNPKYITFDLLTLEEFNARHSDRLFEDRIDGLINLLTANKTNWAGVSKMVTWAAQTPVIDWDHIDLLMADARANKWEGLIIQKNAPYKGKRSNNILKVKKFYDAEFVCVRAEMGEFSKANKAAGKVVTETVLAQIYVAYKGGEVKVGSGFSMEDRRRYAANPELIVGKEITVRYFEKTTNRNGGESLRFPTLKKVWEDGKRDI